MSVREQRHGSGFDGLIGRHQAGGDGSWGENEAVYILDPDGHRVEIFWGLATIDPDGTHRTAEGEAVPGSRTEEL